MAHVSKNTVTAPALQFYHLIRRLHGIPHQLQRPGQGIIVYSLGCEAFTKQCEGKEYIKFDRTLFYVEMAKLERKLREAVGFAQRLNRRFTVYGCSKHKTVNCKPTTVNLFTSYEKFRYRCP